MEISQLPQRTILEVPPTWLWKKLRVRILSATGVISASIIVAPNRDHGQPKATHEQVVFQSASSYDPRVRKTQYRTNGIEATVEGVTRSSHGCGEDTIYW